jgi:hypothetical protein
MSSLCAMELLYKNKVLHVLITVLSQTVRRRKNLSRTLSPEAAFSDLELAKYVSLALYFSLSAFMSLCSVQYVKPCQTQTSRIESGLTDH